MVGLSKGFSPFARTKEFCSVENTTVPTAVIVFPIRCLNCFLFGSYALALLITTPIFGMISDKLGRRGPMLWGILGLAAATLLFAFANTFWFLLLVRILQGCAAAITWTAGLALLADFYPSEKTAKIGRASCRERV